MEIFHFGIAAERLTTAFAEILAETPKDTGGGAALALWHGEECLVSLHGGEASPGIPWTATTPCLIWSASKGIASACALHALQEQKISLEERVATLWPEFSAQGKGEISLAELLSHRAGLAALDSQGLSITDHEAIASALAAQSTNWRVDGISHGYGPRTFGFLLDEIVRRVTGKSLPLYWNTVFREPLNLPLWFGLPEEYLASAATLLAPRIPPSSNEFSRAFGDPSSLTRRALSEPGRALTPSVMNTPTMRRAAIPSLGAIGTADALARFYGLLSKEHPLFTPKTRSWMQGTLSQGCDLTLLDKTSFSAGFMTNTYGVYGPGKFSFGHPGAGGSLSFADPERHLGFAFIPSAMHPGTLPSHRTQKLVRALYGMKESA
jgi:CubicO group peptidase (beta-lactamase class C family)